MGSLVKSDGFLHLWVVTFADEKKCVPCFRYLCVRILFVVIGGLYGE